MTMSSTPAVKEAPALAQGRGSAYEAANWHLVRAGLLLAGSGVPSGTPEMQALAAALRVVNRAGGIEEPKTMRQVSEVPTPPQSQPRTEVKRGFPAVGGSGPWRSGRVA